MWFEHSFKSRKIFLNIWHFIKKRDYQMTHIIYSKSTFVDAKGRKRMLVFSCKPNCIFSSNTFVNLAMDYLKKKKKTLADSSLCIPESNPSHPDWSITLTHFCYTSFTLTTTALLRGSDSLWLRQMHFGKLTVDGSKPRLKQTLLMQRQMYVLCVCAQWMCDCVVSILLWSSDKGGFFEWTF